MANENISSVLWELSETSPIIYPYQCILFAFSWGRGVSSGKWKSGFPFIGLSWDTLRNGLLFFPYFLNYHHLCIESFYENRRTNIKPENDSAFFARWSSCSHIVFHSTFHFLLFFPKKGRRRKQKLKKKKSICLMAKMVWKELQIFCSGGVKSCSSSNQCVFCQWLMSFHPKFSP